MDDDMDDLFERFVNHTKHERHLIAYLSQKNESVLSLFIFDPRNMKNRKRYDITDVPAFVKNLDEFCKEHVQYFILNVFGFNHPAFPHNIVFCQKLIYSLSLYFMSFHFVTNEILTLTSLLIAANITPSVANDVLILTVQENSVNVVQLQGPQTFGIVHRSTISCVEEDIDAEKLAEEALSNVKPSKILLSNLKSTPKRDKIMAALKSALPSNKLMVFDNFKWDACKTIQELTTSCKTGSSSPYLIIPQTCRSFVVGKCDSMEHRDLCKNDILMTSEIHVEITRNGASAEIFCKASRSHKKFYIGILNSDKETCFMLPKMTAEEGHFHQYELCLAINQNNDPVLYQDGTIIEQIEYLPSLLTKTIESKIPVIEFFDNSSVICVWNKKKNGYKFSEKWNGLYGKDLFLSFEDATPKLTNKFSTKRSFVVYDILKILATPFEELKIDPDWEFILINYQEENTVLLQYDTNLGIRNASTPNDLMKLLLKEHLKVIKDETGVSPASIGICISDCYEFLPEYKSSLEKKLHGICESMEIRCEFIKFD